MDTASNTIACCYVLHLHATVAMVAIAMVPLMCLVALYVMVSTSLHPYDVLECEPELVSGWYVDLGGVCFMCIYLSEGISVGPMGCTLHCQPLYSLDLALMLEEIGLDLAIAGIWATLDIP